MKWPSFGLGKKDSAVSRAIAFVGIGQPKWTPRQYDKLADEAYVRNVIGYACTRLIAQSAAAIPRVVKMGNTELSEHPVISLLNRPNRHQTGAELLEAFYSYYMLAGNSYVEAVALDETNVDELYTLRPDRMKAIPGPRGWVIEYEYKVNSQTVRFDVNVGRKQSPIMHFKAFHPLNDYYGMSPIEAGAFGIDVHNAAGGFSKALLDNAARPSGALSTDQNLGDEQFNRAKTELKDQYSGEKNNGKPMLLEGGLKWVPFALTPQELDFIESKREMAREIALAFGVPPLMLGIPGDNTYSNYQEANRAFYRQTVMPLSERGLAAFAMFLAPTYGEKLVIEPDFDDLPALAEERKLLWERLNSATFISLDEKRDAAGYTPYKPDPENPATQVFVSSAQVPIEMSGFEAGGEEPEDEEDPNAETDPEAPEPGEDDEEVDPDAPPQE